MTGRVVTMLFGPCEAAKLVEAGTLRSTATAEAFHSKCSGALARPDEAIRAQFTGQIIRYEPQDPIYCSCECHEGVVVEPPKPEHRAPKIVPGKRDVSLLDKWGDLYRTVGRVEVDAPEPGTKEFIALRNRLHTAAYRRELKVKVRLDGGKLVATVKGLAS